ncbi:MAG TPA: CotH kinase family protein, partial [Anaerolineae bacterium]
FRLFFKGVYGATKLEYPIFPDSPVEAFDTLVLRGGVNRSYAGHIRFAPGPNTLATYTRDEWMRSSQRDMSGIGSHGIFVHLYLNGLYWGLYNVVERPDASFSAAYLGGDKEEWFARDNRYPISGSSTRFDTLIRLIDAGGLETPARYEAIKPYLDIDMFIDYMILNWYAGNADWGDKNVYIGVQNPAGQVKIYMWDSEIIWGDGADIYLGRLRRRNIPRLIFEGLIQNPDFRMKLADRMYLHLFNGGPLTDANSKARWLHINHVIEQAIIGESARWGDARYETPITQADWFNARDNVLAQMEGNADRLIRLARQEGYYPEFDPPQFNQHGGLISPGFELSMLAPTGTIYYTTDGSDPRVDGSSAVAPNAMVYELPLVPTSTTHIKARTWAGGVWSALHQVTFKITEQDRQLRLTEIMYNPADGDDYEFLELKNVGQSPLDLSGVAFSGIRYVFPAGTDQLRPGQFVVLARNPTAFKDRYPNVPITGVYDGQLSNKGEQILLVDAAGNEILSIDYDDENGWPISPDGRGDSLVLVDPNGDPTDPRNWQASTSLNGSPGADDPLFITGNPTLNAGMTP